MARPDVVEEVGARLGVTDPRCGFVAYAPACVADAAPGAGQLHVEVELKGGEVGYKGLPAPKLAGNAAVKRVLESVQLAPDEIAPAFDTVLGPPLAAINRARLARPRRRSVVEFGDAEPRAGMLGDRARSTGGWTSCSTSSRSCPRTTPRAHELVYVLDDPPRKGELLDLAHSAHRRFGVPFRVVALEENLGYGPANNVGLEHARGEFICFLNSDVVPQEPRWLELMLEALRADPALGVVGARLLFEDGTVQHDGMAFERLPQLANWPFPMHPGKGRLPRGEAAAEAGGGGGGDRRLHGAARRPGPRARRLRRGLRHRRLRGHRPVPPNPPARACAAPCDRRARLFHLERQSQVTPDRMWRFYVTLFNAWTHTRRWFPEAHAELRDNSY